MGGITPTYEWALRNAHIPNSPVREAFAEFFGTMLLCFMVVGSGIQGLLHADSHAIGVFGTVFGLMVCILIFGGISGAHINPAVSIGLALAGHLHWGKVPLYIAVQIFGGFLGSLLAYGLYKDHIQYILVGDPNMSIPDFDMLNGSTIVGAFSPSPRTFLGVGFATEIVLTAILLMTVMAVIDKGNMKVPTYLVAFLLALTVAGLAMAYSQVTGTLLNPARDFAPRLAAYALGWDRKLCFQNQNFRGETQEWWVVGVFAPPIGACIGVLLYTFVVGAQLTNNRDEIGASVGENNNYGKGDDWRNTVFIPRHGAPPPPPPAVHGHVNGHVNGHFNPGYIREDMRQRQGY